MILYSPKPIIILTIRPPGGGRPKPIIIPTICPLPPGGR